MSYKSLTARQQEVADAVASGKKVSVISRELHISRARIYKIIDTLKRTNTIINRLEYDRRACCDGCNIYTGVGHIYSDLNLFREHKICQGCIDSWKRLDKTLGKEHSWDEFLHPRCSQNYGVVSDEDN